MTALHQVLRERRVQLGMTQYDLAPLMGMGQPQLSELELGKKTPLWSTVLKWTAALRIELVPHPIEPPVDSVHAQPEPEPAASEASQ